MPKFYTRFDRPPSPAFRIDSESLSGQSVARQEFKSECDINEIVRRFKVDGFLCDPSQPRTRKPLFGDFSGIPTEPADRANLVIAAEARWQELPAAARAHWPGGWPEVLEALNHGQRLDDLVALGLIQPNHSEAAEAATPEPGVQPESKAKAARAAVENN